MINMEIVKYKPEYKNDFIRLSKNWITKYFALESDDFEVFENIDKLIKNGAMIYFAVENGVVYATGGADIFLDYFMLIIQDYVCTLPGSYSREIFLFVLCYTNQYSC